MVFFLKFVNGDEYNCSNLVPGKVSWEGIPLIVNGIVHLFCQKKLFSGPRKRGGGKRGVGERRSLKMFPQIIIQHTLLAKMHTSQKKQIVKVKSWFRVSEHVFFSPWKPSSVLHEVNLSMLLKKHSNFVLLQNCKKYVHYNTAKYFFTYKNAMFCFYMFYSYRMIPTIWNDFCS